METAYLFAGGRFDAQAGVLTLGGRTASLRPRTGAVLVHLLQHAGEIVTKDELLQAVWPDLVVTENSLSQCVKEIRRELGDAEESLLRTIHRRGYVLETRVERAISPPATTTRRMSLMVLPLVNLGGDPDQDYFAEGLTEDLTMDLGRMPGAFVINRGTALAYADRRADARLIGRELGVRYLVEGSVRRGPQDIVVNLSVCETGEARQVWAERLTAARNDLLALQRSMAGRVSQMLHLDLLNVESEMLEQGRSPHPEALDLVTRAFSLKVRSAPGLSPEVEPLIQRALELDPECADAWAMRSEVSILRLSTRNYASWAEMVAQAESAAHTALTLEPGHRTANCWLGAALAFQGRFEESLGHLERQMALNPNHAAAHNWVGIVHTLMGNGHLAIRPQKTAIDLSPRDPRLSTWIRGVALAWLHQGEDARALVEAERCVSVPNPWPRSYETLAMAYAVNGLLEEAGAAVKVLLDRWPAYSIAQHRAEMMSRRPAFLAQRERLLEGLRQAGLPES